MSLSFTYIGSNLLRLKVTLCKGLSYELKSVTFDGKPKMNEKYLYINKMFLATIEKHSFVLKIPS